MRRPALIALLVVVAALVGLALWLLGGVEVPEALPGPEDEAPVVEVERAEASLPAAAAPDSGLASSEPITPDDSTEPPAVDDRPPGYGLEVRGTALHPDGRPAVEAQVELVWLRQPNDVERVINRHVVQEDGTWWVNDGEQDWDLVRLNLDFLSAYRSLPEQFAREEWEAAGGEAARPAFVVEPRAWIEGTVTDAGSGDPVPAWIELDRLLGTRRAEPDGSFSLAVQPGERLRFEHRGWLSLDFDPDVSEGERRRQVAVRLERDPDVATVRLHPVGVVEGRWQVMAMPDGEGAERRVGFLDELRREAGVLVLDALPAGAWRLLLRRPGRRSIELAVAPEAGAVLDRKITIVDEARVRLRPAGNGGEDWIPALRIVHLASGRVVHDGPFQGGYPDGSLTTRAFIDRWKSPGVRRDGGEGIANTGTPGEPADWLPPWIIDDLDAGDHRITAELEGKRAEGVFTAVAGRTVEVDLRFE